MNRSWVVLVPILAAILAWLFLEAAPESKAGTDVRPRERGGSELQDGAILLERQVRTEPARAEVTVVPPPAVPRPVGASLEVRVSFDDEPVAGAIVELVPFDNAHGFLVGQEYAALPARAATDARGIARFEGQPPDTYGLSASIPIGATGRTRIQLTPDDASVQASLRFGSASLEGSVHDLDGRAAAELLVIARQNARADEVPIWFAAKTDAGGNYHLPGIAGGPGRAIVASVLDLGLGDTAPFEIAPGETRRLEFGSPDGRARWSGSVRFASGEVLAGTARLYFTARVNETIATGFLDERGRFDVVLPSGEYTAHLDGPMGSALGRAEVSGAIVQDLVVPPIVLHGRVRYVGTKHPVAKGPEHDVQIALARSDGAPMRPGFLRVDSRYTWFGLEPGSYVVTTSPWIVDGSTDGRAVVEIGPGTDEMVFDLPITDP